MDQPRQYESKKYVATLLSFLVFVSSLTFLLSSGWSIRLRSYLQTIANSQPAVVMLYALIIGALLTILQLPFDFYSGYFLEHRFGLSRQSALSWAKDELLGLAISVPLWVAGVELLYYLLRSHSNLWWIYAAGAFITFAVVMTNLAPILILPLFFKFTPVENAELKKRVERLARRTGAAVCGLFEWALGNKTRKANAAVIGWGNTRRIIISDTLLQNFSGEEIETVLAHEICHHVKHHIWQMMAFQSLLTLCFLYAAHRIVQPLLTRFGFAGIADVANLPLFALILAFLSLMAVPAVNYFSRRLETVADLYALDMTGDALAFVSSMEKLAELNLANKSPNKFIEFIFYSHPSVETRIKLAADRVGQNV
jgi:STE24 endopeptidase